MSPDTEPSKPEANGLACEPGQRGERVRTAISRRGIRKLMALAAEIGVTEGALTRWRQGGPMSLENGIRLCHALDVSLDWLAMGRADLDHHRQLVTPERQLLLAALNALPEGSEADLARFLDQLVAAAGLIRLP